MKQANAMRYNRGFSLIEAMIGFFILSIGMLGIASLQGISLKAGKTSVYNSVAMMKVDELLESMRANPAVLASYMTSGAFNDCGNVDCTPVQLAAEDVYWWKKNLKAGLPDTATTTTAVTVLAPTPPSRLSRVTVSINWLERSKSTTSGESKSYSMETDICTQFPC